MNQGAVLHKGLLTECKVCNSTTETQEKRVRRARSKTGVSLDVVIRRQVASDLGEDEPQKDERFQLLQKYGVVTPRIDRLVTRPPWMPIAEFKRKLNDFFKATKGMIVPQQRKQWQDRNRVRSTTQGIIANTKRNFNFEPRNGIGRTDRKPYVFREKEHIGFTTDSPSQKSVR